MAHKRKTTKSPNALMATPVEDIDWRAKGDMRTLREAEEIKSDRKRLAAAKKCAKEEICGLEKVAGRK